MKIILFLLLLEAMLPYLVSAGVDLSKLLGVAIKRMSLKDGSSV